ncbi:hypothetical protein NDU88_007984 [Pleurodeles waltl]|uniref:Uncharacterized protein n=1 Tax=Pleurodeles waltl TaxID=8319 RepID=A0AAV7SUC4_PLEWA|nr:hypothetical protein NDU88_007984 [Pleurodeles waltl]
MDTSNGTYALANLELKLQTRDHLSRASIALAQALMLNRNTKATSQYPIERGAPTASIALARALMLGHSTKATSQYPIERGAPTASVTLARALILSHSTKAASQ